MSNIYGATALTGGGTKALDGSTYYDGDDLVDGDGAVVITNSSVLAFHLDASSGAAENSPQVIKPDANAGNKRWLLKEGVFAGLTLYGNIVMPNLGTIGQAAGPLIKFDDGNNRLNITGCEVMIGTGTPPELFSVNGKIWSNNSLQIMKDGSDTIAAGPNIYISNAVNDRALCIQLSADHNLDFWTYSGASWERKMILKNLGGLALLEQAAAVADVAAYGQIWVKNTTPNQLWFTRDDGTDVQIA